MKVVVTGSSGKVGRAAMAALKAAGHRAIGLDVKPAPGQRTVSVDCNDFGAVMGALSGIDMVYTGVPDAVVHLAAYPAPGLTTDHGVFDLNLMSTYNVFTACARLGIKRVAWASSETVMGIPYSPKNPPAYAPLDEDHPARPMWSYSLTKHLGEEMADAFVRWHPAMSILSLRFSYVHVPEDYHDLAERQAKPEGPRFDLWGYVDAEDTGLACRLACEAELSGHHAMIIAAKDNLMGLPSAELMRDHFPEIPIKGTLVGEESLLSSAKAKALIGYEPRISWRDRV
jgi:nucleoside-diphosphate-sugar epimerase